MKHTLKQQWDERYSSEEYIYGESPNQYFSSQLAAMNPGHLLLPGEGEGRNAVFAALEGWRVTAFDISTEARRKAINLATARGVSIEYLAGEFGEFEFQNGTFDAIALIFVHMHHSDRLAYTLKLIEWLRPGGTLIMEVFSRNQIKNDSGGPKDINMLFTLEDITADLSGLTIVEAYEAEVSLSEGTWHSGRASVIRVTAVKPFAG
ncbi:MAG: class I SAM-dependent methyltransferase [Bacteroidales bacterium]|nr:class I SAM-dependent methyltransferase [Bacteroidales bacterium]